MMNSTTINEYDSDSAKTCDQSISEALKDEAESASLEVARAAQVDSVLQELVIDKVKN